jgi:hypothetical protein
LPLHADLTGQSSGNVQGVNRAHLIADMQNISTTVDPALFELPEGLTKLTEEQIKQQVQTIGQFLQFALSALNSQMGNAPSSGGTATPPSPPPPASGASPSTSPGASPPTH